MVEYRDHDEKAARSLMHIVPDPDRASPEWPLDYAVEFTSDGVVAEDARRICLYVDFDTVDRVWVSPLQVPVDAVEKRLVITQQIFNRVQFLRKSGLYSLPALRLEHEIFSEVTKTYQENRVSNEDLERVMRDQVSLFRRFYSEAISRGILSPSADMMVMGVPLADFLSGPRS